MDFQSRMEIEWQCLRVCHDFADRIDRHMYEEVAELFTPDGAFERNGEVLLGRAAIVASLKKRPADIITRHVTANFRTTTFTRDVVDAVHYNLSFVGRADARGTHRVEVTPATVIDMEDRFVRSADRWLLERRVARRILEGHKVALP